MATKFEEMAVVVSQKQIATDIYDLTIQTKEIAAAAKAGQFISLYCNDGTKLLPRPISLCGIDREAGTLRMVYRVTGENTGTKEFSKMVAGDEIRVLGPLGNGFELGDKKAFCIGGGIGIPPMLQLAKELKCEKTAVLGYRNELFLLDDFEAVCDTIIATEDGSAGTKGNVIDAIKANAADAEVIYACGPMPMLRAIKRYAEAKQIKAYISLEEHMACGVGACLGCVVKTKEVDHHSHVHNARICTDGPVFDAEEVDI